MRSRPASAAALSCALLLLTGCAYLTGGLSPYGKDVTADQLTGSWTGDCNSTLTINADLTASATDFPVAADSSTFTTRVSGAGTWRIVPREKDGTPEKLDLTFDSKGNEVDFAQGPHGSLILSDQVGDPDLGIACRYTHD
ncbi:hypothetical protein GCM10010441_20700 [Kitasatospora paracochleata]|uniref:Lipoprotein n=1 Tax=Kitasatospora paracochleata TaxID=58354 RepID=A0ABT1J7Z2_9ACTN|nr:hypothetical protein [Kitasatospora paracochleata]MCP2313553.1 hypothetical protein [Kitasatospora paracochleata]